MRKKGDPIDHVVVNLRMRDLVTKVRVNTSLVISDHYPLCVKFVTRPLGQPVVRWPSKPDSLTPIHVVPFPNHECHTFNEWQTRAVRWIEETCDAKIPPKNKLSHTTIRKPKVKVDLAYKRLLSIQSSVDHLVSHGLKQQSWRALQRKLKALGTDGKELLGLSPSTLQGEVPKILKKLMDHDQECALARWRKHAKEWKVSSSKAFMYVKNPSPAKTTVVQTTHGAISKPDEVELALMTYWADVESWPVGTSVASALYNLQERFSFLLPHVPFDTPLEGRHVQDVTKMARGSSTAGLDTWTFRELKLLPRRAWDLLVYLFTHKFSTFFDSLTCVVKRVPIEKYPSVCSPDQIRPIDLFSAILRVLSSATFCIIRPWAFQVLHPSQLASQGGAWKAAAKIALLTELSVLGWVVLCGVSSDFEKMFNRMSVNVAANVAHYCGLSDSLIRLLIKPVSEAAFVWRLPYNGVPRQHMNERGLPQGLAGSVMLAELTIAPLLWKIERALQHHEELEMVAYVDDINVTTGDVGALSRVLDIMCEYEDSLHLRLSRTKTKIWSSLPHIPIHTPFEQTNVLDALGAQWPIQKASKPVHTKELERIKEAERRLLRVRHAPVSIVLKYDLISVGCLSLIDYIGHPRITTVGPLVSAVKRALAQPYAAPEILYNLLVKTSVDPSIRWLLASLRLWYLVLKQEPTPAEVDVLSHNSRGRLGMSARELRKREILIEGRGISVGGALLPTHQPWYLCRVILVKHLKQIEFQKVARRRPNCFGGLSTVSEKTHRKYLATLPEYKQGVLIRVWTGSAMTKEKANRIGRGSAECECGAPSQTMHHLLWECPFSPPIPPSLAHVPALPPFRSSALLLPKGVDNRDIATWKSACARAYHILSQDRHRPSTPIDPLPPRDLKGHSPCTSEDGLYVYCGRCFISRKSRDLMWLCTKPCPHAERNPIVIGEGLVVLKHRVTLIMKTWKTASQRPAWKCANCDLETWATSSIGNECPGDPGSGEVG